MFNKHLTLKQYRKKYHRYLPYLLKFHKSEVKKFDFDNDYYELEAAKGRFGLDKFVLEGRKFILIGDTYYEIPRAFTSLWFKTLNKPTKAAAAAVILAAVTFGTLKGLKIIGSSPITYTISFDCDGGTIGGESIKQINNKTIIEAAPNPKKDGYIFDGWWKTREIANSEYIYKDPISFPYEVKADSTIYAKWNIEPHNTFIVTFDSNGGSKINDLQVLNGGVLTNLETPTKDYYKFNCWCTDKELSKPYNNEPIIKNTTLYAKYDQIAFDVTLNLNGQGVTPPEGSVLEGGKYLLKNIQILEVEPAATKTDASLKGWSDNGGTDLITYPYKVNKAGITLTAVWGNVQEYTVKFDANGGEPTPIADKVCSHITSLPTVTRKGYALEGWYDESDNRIDDLVKQPGGYSVTKAQTFKAKWTLSEFTVNLHLDDEIVKTLTNVSCIDKAPEYPIEDYDLKWYRLVEDSKEYVTFPFYPDSDTDLYGEYIRNAYKLEIYDDASNALISSYNHVSTITSGMNPKLEKANFTTSYVAKGNSIEKVVNFDGTEKTTDFINLVESDILKVYVKYTRKENCYDLTLNYPSFAKKDSITLHEQHVIDLTKLEHYEIESYTFKGWSKTEKGTIITETELTISDDTNIYAIYEQSAHDITLSYITSSSETPLKTVTLENISSATYKKADLPTPNKLADESNTYTFSKWTTDKAGTKTLDDTFNVTEGLTLYAHYLIGRTLTLEYYDESTSTPKYITYKTLTDQVNVELASLPIPYLVDYEFAGFKYKKDGSEIITDKTISLTEDTTLVAVMTQKYFTVTFDSNGGTCDVTKLEHITSGTTIKSTQVKDPVKSGNTFKYWYKDDEEIEFDFNTPITENITLHAKWEKDPVVTFPNVVFTISETDYTAGARFADTTERTLTINDRSSVSSTACGSITYTKHALDGWYIDEAYATPASFPYTSDITLYAKFIELSDYCSIQFNANGGVFSDGSTTKTTTTTIGTKFTALTKPEATLTNYKFDYWQVYDVASKSYIKVSDDFTLTSNIYFYAHYTEDIDTGTSINFASANWATIAYHADQGLSHLKTVCGLASTDSFVGKTRTVKYNNVDFTVRVIGEKHDTIASSNSSLAALTFEFTSCITTEIYNPSMYTGNSNNWGTSNARKLLRCDSDYVGDFAYLMEDQLKNHVQTVVKKTMYGCNDTSGTAKNTLVDTNDTFFFLSAYELGLTTIISGDNNEGTTYSYYSDSSHSKVKQYSGSDTSYWIRSPYNSKYSPQGSPTSWYDGVLGSGVYSITTSGAVETDVYSFYADVYRGYAPAFCIGVDSGS